MGAFDRFRRRVKAVAQPAQRHHYVRLSLAGEEALRAQVQADPNDVETFAELAEIVRRRAAEGHEAGDPQRAADDAVWALAEELAHSGRAWYPLVEMARLSITGDREAAMRRLGTAAERDPSGHALAMGLKMLRETGHPGEALSLGVGHWRPHEHDVEAGRHLVEAAVEAGRHGEARRHLDALAGHPDQGSVAPLRAELERLIAASERARAQRGIPPTGEMPRIVDVRETKTRTWGFRRR